MGKNEDRNNNYSGSSAEYRKDDGAKRRYNDSNGFGSQTKSHRYDETVDQLFTKQFSMPNSNKWKLPELKTMLSSSKWEVIIALYGFPSFQSQFSEYPVVY